MTPRQLLTRMKEGRIPERRIEGNRPVWRVSPDGAACAYAVRTLLDRGWAEGFYPSNGGHLYLTEEGKKA